MIDHKNNVILVVDDNLNNIRVVIDYLKESGFETAVARNGRTGIERARLLHPLLILLDVMMPEMDGYEVCRQLKADEGTQDIPVIFMTALDSIDDKLKAFAVGGVDYISKPAQKKEVLARVTAHARLRQQARELKASREAAEQANRAKSTFLANMSHELRSPLGTILGFSQLLHHDKNLTPYQLENLNIIQRSGEHLLRLIDQVLDLSKIEAGHLQLDPHDFNLSSLLYDMKEMFRVRCEKKGLQLSVESAPDLPKHIHLDELKLRQILINLLTNAVKFTQNGGHVTLRAGVKNAKTANQTPNSPDSNAPVRLCFEVKDDGVGISTEEQQTLFEAFSQSASGRQAREGTGLGLTISQKFVQLLGGEIHVDSAPGQGSCFSFEITCEIAEVQAVEHEADDTRQVLSLAEGQPRFKLLIVDDNDDNRRLLVKLFEPLGFALREATHGAEAVTLWQEWSPELIFMDMRMPDIDGLEATRRIRALEAGTHTPIIAVTANSLREDRQAILEAGCDDITYKPFREHDIFQGLRKYLGVEFIYDADVTVSGADGIAMELAPEEIPVSLAACTPEFLEELQSASETTEVRLIAELIASIQKEQPRLAGTLDLLSENFDYEKILHYLRQAKKLSTQSR